MKILLQCSWQKWEWHYWNVSKTDEDSKEKYIFKINKLRNDDCSLLLLRRNSSLFSLWRKRASSHPENKNNIKSGEKNSNNLFLNIKTIFVDRLTVCLTPKMLKIIHKDLIDISRARFPFKVYWFSYYCAWERWTNKWFSEYYIILK